MGTVLIGRTTVDLDTLTPRAAAVARLWSMNPLGTPCSLILESRRTLREMGADPDEVEMWDEPGAMDRPHRIVWQRPSTLPGGVAPMPIVDRVEHVARVLPIDYVPVAIYRDRALSESERDTAAGDDEITCDQVVTLLRKRGRPLSVPTVRNYTSKPIGAPAGWPPPVRYVGRTPLWSAAQIENFAQLPR